MKIEIEELVSAKSNEEFADYELQSGLQGGNIYITLNNGNCYEFTMQKFVDKMIHRTYGKGFIKNIKKYEENN